MSDTDLDNNEREYQNMINDYINAEPSINDLFNYFGGECNEIAKIRIERHFRRFPEFEQQYDFLKDIIEEFDIKVETRKKELISESSEEQNVNSNNQGWLESFQDFLISPLIAGAMISKVVKRKIPQNIPIFSGFSIISGVATASEISDNLKFEFPEEKIHGVIIDDEETGELTVDVFTKDTSLLGCLLVLKAGNSKFSDIFRRIDNEELGVSFSFSKEQRESVEPKTILEIEEIIPYEKIQQSDIDKKTYDKIILMQQNGDAEEKYISELIFEHLSKNQ